VGYNYGGNWQRGPSVCRPGWIGRLTLHKASEAARSDNRPDRNQLSMGDEYQRRHHASDARLQTDVGSVYIL